MEAAACPGSPVGRKRQLLELDNNTELVGQQGSAQKQPKLCSEASPFASALGESALGGRLCASTENLSNQQSGSQAALPANPLTEALQADSAPPLQTQYPDLDLELEAETFTPTQYPDSEDEPAAGHIERSLEGTRYADLEKESLLCTAFLDSNEPCPEPSTAAVAGLCATLSLDVRATEESGTELGQHFAQLVAAEHCDKAEGEIQESGQLPDQPEGADVHLPATQYPDFEDYDLPEPADEEPEPARVVLNLEGARQHQRHLNTSKASIAPAKSVDISFEEAVLDELLAAEEADDDDAPVHYNMEEEMEAMFQDYKAANQPLQHKPVPALHSWLRKDPPPEIAPAAHRPIKDHPRPEVASRGAVDDLPGRVFVPPRRFAGNIDGMVMSVTDTSGERVYCSLLDEPEGASELMRRQHKGQLLSQSIGSLLEEVEQDAYAKAVRATEQAERIAMAEERQIAEASTSGWPASDVCVEQLWVDKYSPCTFLDLLSDEQINREVLKWLKSWDRIVFGYKEPHKGRFGHSKGKQAQQVPEQRILLLCGAPGLGKTTLAHVVAKHCGYRPVEINASDDRSSAALHARITDAAQMQSVKPCGRPNCILIDEIDGAAGGAEGRSAINTLLRLTQSAPSKAAAKEQQGPGTFLKKNNKKASQPLNRPIIAICNDIYAPALRPLRSIAKIVTFKQPQVDKLVVRLRMVAAKEELQVDRQGLVMLCERTDCDVRSCLNTLQFLAKKKKRIRAAEISSLNIGQKDMTKGAFSVWEQLLSTRGQPKSKPGDQTDRLFRMLSDFGDHELVLMGVHENVLGQRYLDTHLRHTCAIFDHLQFADVLLTATCRTMDYGLMSYIPAALLTVRSIVAGPERPWLQWPKGQSECSRNLAANQALLQGWLLDVCRSACFNLTPRTAVQEVLPCLLRVLCRPLRAVAPNLFTAAEKAVMGQLISTLIDYGVTFDMSVPEAANDASPLLLKPGVHSLCSFPSFAVQHKRIPPAVRRVIAHEAQMERLRRKDQTHSREGSKNTNKADNMDVDAIPSQATEAKASASRPDSASNKLLYTVAERAQQAGTEFNRKKVVKKSNWLDQLRESKAQRKPSAAALRRQVEAGGQSNPIGSAPSHLPVLYKFKEGYTNAVKRPVLMKELL